MNQAIKVEGSKMSFIQISLECPKKKVKSFSEILTNFGAEAITALDAKDEPILEPKPGTAPMWSRTKVVGLFHAGISTNLITQKLISVGGENVSADALEDKDWVMEWMQYFQPIEIAQDFWVCPTWQEMPPKGLIQLKLTPGMAFGTGTHPTTSLCLRWLNANRSENLRVLDYGCGSGILSIGALLLGAAHVDAVDYDPQAITATLNNAKINEVDDKLSVYLPEDFKDVEPYDVIVANILAEPLISLAPMLESNLKENGHIVLSGLIESQIEKVMSAYPSIQFSEPMLEEEWVRLTGIKQSLLS